MRLERLEMEDFRLVHRATMELAPGANLFIGENAQGKTTILEAVSYLATGRSFRTSKDRECIRMADSEERMATFAAAETTFVAHNTERRARITLAAKNKSYWLDGKALKRLGDLWGTLNTVTFAPTDIQLVQGSPTQRREYLGALLARTSKLDLQNMQAYAVALRNRNALLRLNRTAPPGQYEAYEEQMAKYGALLLRGRERLVRLLRPLIAERINELTDRTDRLTIRHEIGWPETASLEVEEILEEGPTFNRAVEKMRYLWARDRQADMRRGHTEHGPQRGDLALLINGFEARGRASQGQARSLALALRFAELDLLEKRTGDSPVLLLDDVLGELDQRRANYFIDLLERRGTQSLITATDATTIGSRLTFGRRFHVRGGTVQKAATE